MIKFHSVNEFLNFFINALVFGLFLFLVQRFVIPIQYAWILYTGCLVTSLLENKYKIIAIFLTSMAYIVFSNLIFSIPLDVEMVHLNLYFRLIVYLSVLLLFLVIYFLNKFKLIKFPLITIILIYLALKYFGVQYKLDYLVKMSAIWSLGSLVFMFLLKNKTSTWKDVGGVVLPWQIFYQFPVVDLSQEMPSPRKKILINRGVLALVFMILGYAILNLGFATFELINQSVPSINVYFEKLNYIGSVNPLKYFILRGDMLKHFSLTMLVIHYLNGYFMILNLFCLVALPYAFIQFSGIDIPFPLKNPFQSSNFFDFFKRILGPFVSVMFYLFFIPSWTFFSKIFSNHRVRIFVVLAWIAIVGRFILRAVPLGLMNNGEVDPTLAFINSSREQIGFLILMVVQSLFFYASYRLRTSKVITGMPIVIRSFCYINAYYTTFLLVPIIGYLIFYRN